MAKRTPLLPWYIGVAIILVADLWEASRLFSAACQAPDLVAPGVVIVIPAVYLAPMYLNFRSQP